MPDRFLLPLIISFLLSVTAYADVIEHGGHPERIKGDGDMVPPQCQFDFPNSATSAFWVEWSCFDNFTPQENIRTELWVFRQQDLRPILMESFLGFPASARIDESVLETTDFAGSLPVGLRLRAIDFAGNSTTSPMISVGTTSNSLSSCSVALVTEAVASTETITGTPSLTVSTSGSEIISSRTGTNIYNISTSTASETTNCEVDSVCLNDNQISFSGTFEVDVENGSVSGEVSLSPGEVTAEVSGAATPSGNTLSVLQAEGSTTVDGTPATFSISCNP